MRRRRGGEDVGVGSGAVAMVVAVVELARLLVEECVEVLVDGGRGWWVAGGGRWVGGWVVVGWRCDCVRSGEVERDGVDV